MSLDVRAPLRVFRASPGFAAAAVATLALGIGASTAVFSVVRAVLLRSPAFARPERVVALWEKNPKESDEENPPSAADFDDWVRGARSFERLALVDARLEFNLSEGGRPVRAIREAVRATDAGQAVAAVRPLADVVAGSLAQPRLRASLVGAFGAVALALAAIGLYGLLSFSVARRTREIGVRMALGARASEVLRLVVSEGLALAAAGVAAGLAGSLALSGLLSRFLFSVEPADPAVLAGSGALLLIVAAAASAVPALKAARIDPMAALRND